MHELFKTKFLAGLFFIFIPLELFAQEDGDAFRDIEPPPTPIDDYVVYFAVAVVLFVGYYFHKSNLKTVTK